VTRRPGVVNRLLAIATVSAAPAVVVAVVLLVRSDLATWARAALGGAVVLTWLVGVLVVRARSRYHLGTLSNLLAALREGDYSFRVRDVSRADPYGEVVAELNSLSETLRRQRVDDLEATALVRTVMGSIDVAVFAFDSSNRLRQVNDAGLRLLGGTGSYLGLAADQLGLEDCLSGPSARTVELDVGGTTRRWELRRGDFRQHGRPHRLVVLSDVSRALRAEELAAWKRLIRVIGHELNNSLAPITSLAGSMARLIEQEPLPADWHTDLGRGLGVISSRAEALTRFMSDCSRLAKMPEPSPTRIDIASCVRRIAELETRHPVRVIDGPEAIVTADQDQIEQVLINLVRNAVEASPETGDAVEILWSLTPHQVEVVVRDQGPGLPDSANLFVPFFSTKPEGSGIGLFLCRQIAEAHGGALTVENRSDGPGCDARLTLPFTPARPGSPDPEAATS
jgi:nitrogen fixation/metabolism regulation signal transduction histidine kinase